MDLAWNIMLFLVGCFSGLASGFLGVGGGFIVVPLLVFMGVRTHIAIGSSLAYIVFTGTSGVYQHHKLGDCNLKLAAPVILGGIFTAQVGAEMTRYLEAEVLEKLLAVVLLAASARMMLPNLYAKQVKATNPSVNFTLATVIGAAVGFLSGLVGVGGGFLLVPLMIMCLKVPIHEAIGTSLLQVVGLAVSGVVRHLLLGNIDGQIVVILATGGAVFAQLGARLCKRCPQRFLQRVFALVLLLFAIRLLFQ
ncbi:MAG: sulfite exporter TauE/SafE family protein [Candidatus Bathyarchaeia archaeon]